MTRAPLSLAVAKMRVQGEREFCLDVEVGSGYSKQFGIPGCGVGFGTLGVNNACFLLHEGYGPGGEKGRHQPLGRPARQLIFTAGLAALVPQRSG